MPGTMKDMKEKSGVHENQLKSIRRLFALFVLLGILASPAPARAGQAETAIPDPCSGPSALLAVLDRPTVADSACAVSQGQVVLEMGYAHASLEGPGSGTSDNYPQAEVRFGLPGRNELVLLPPDYTSQRTHAAAGSPELRMSGLSAVTIGIKHELGYNRRWIGAVEALFTLPSGGDAFGSRGLGAAFSGIASYAPTDETGLSLQLGVSSQTEPKLPGGGRFTSLVSIFVATWQPSERLQFYGEIYGQTKTGPGEGAGYNADGGVQYLITPSWEIDVEEGVRLTGHLGGFTHYFGAGAGFRF